MAETEGAVDLIIKVNRAYVAFEWTSQLQLWRIDWMRGSQYLQLRIQTQSLSSVGGFAYIGWLPNKYTLPLPLNPQKASSFTKRAAEKVVRRYIKEVHGA